MILYCLKLSYGNGKFYHVSILYSPWRVGKVKGDLGRVKKLILKSSLAVVLFNTWLQEK